MNTTVKLRKIFGAYNILDTIKNEAMPSKLAYSIYKTYKALETDTEFFKKRQFELYNENIEKDENGKFIILSQEDDMISYKPIEGGLERMNNGMKELFEMECEVDIHKISIEALENANIVLPPSSFEVLDFIIEI